MRYYNILITDPNTGKLVLQFTSLNKDGSFNPSAQDIQIDVTVYQFSTPAGGSYVRIFGVPLQYVAQAMNLTGMNIIVMAGMSKGLPLANPNQAGIIAQGQIYQSFGNWIGTDQTLDMLLLPKVGTAAAPVHLALAWRAGMKLSDAILSTLTTAYPGFSISVNISSSLVLASDEVGIYSTLAELSMYISTLTKSIIGGNYPGVQIAVKQDKIMVYDASSQTNPKMIMFNDLIGQPTWIDFPSVQTTLVMRGDLNVGDYITLPQALATATAGSGLGTPYRDKATFQGTFLITLVRHVGRYRQPDAASWGTIITSIPTQQNSQTGQLKVPFSNG